MVKKKKRQWQRMLILPHSCTHLSQFNSVQFSHSFMSNSLLSHESQQTRPPCPSPTPRVYWNSCPLSRWCHPAISSSVFLFSSHHQGLFQWVNSLHQVAKVLELQLQHQSFQWIFGLISFRMDWLHLLAVLRDVKKVRKFPTATWQIFCLLFSEAS